MYDVVGYGWGAHPIWLANDTVLEFGARGRWNPMTGEVLPNHPTLGWSGGYNGDFSKLLTVEKKTTGEGVLHIYDTQTWLSQDIAMGGLRIPSAAWTADDRIIAFVHPWVGLVGKQFDGYVRARKEVGRFGGGDIGIAITSDGHQLALGNTGSVQIYNILQ